MPYGKSSASLAADGNELTIKVKLPQAGEPAKSGRSDNLTDPNEWIEVADEFGIQTGIQLGPNVIVPYRRVAELRNRKERRFSSEPRLVRQRPM